LSLLGFERFVLCDRVGYRLYRCHEQPRLVGCPAGAWQEAFGVVAICPRRERECGAFGGRFLSGENEAAFLTEPAQEPPL